MEHPKLAEWWHFPYWAFSELFLYMFIAGLLTMALLLAVWAIAAAAKTSGIGSAYRAARYVTLLLVMALLCGAPANLVFIAWLRYHAYIPGDPVADWLPFIPSGEWIIDPGMNGRFINDGSPEQLRAAWFFLAVPVWAAAWFLTGRLRRAP
jgi:hypothetical protein